ncbi:MAG: hypothetical protein E6K58_06815 [Nitrospirae bacterium]|nr:MAG: hypothetical protein AUH21_06300 [Nitrospirae bacterium 13_2_20CM_62_7]OLB57152.1 MAG: hypothetical protein AUI03_01885 [Nitrospirae bacterium 13_2_20CM_2_62_8]OLC00709.1 MAG: hypothetical protein AUH35_01270 [Nitrospirae bacterium 13_1_40CM_62_7]OLC81235.1 MAG: hypothetical protein AUI96_02290 [Nitrospirae bacterium 13_1_40CM_3_62_11]OLD37511.1 MAG: hypothetical protein AUI21_08650 [Nitrospirae bacterium 13_1_40CM_2_62_10]TLY42822.1 MAG: hypothetical protein E6K58_06815 [Nitrospirota 
MTRPKTRSLTSDEKKAAEAAFQGVPFDPAWSNAARVVYDGITEVLATKERHSLAERQVETEPEAAMVI